MKKLFFLFFFLLTLLDANNDVELSSEEIKLNELKIEKQRVATISKQLNTLQNIEKEIAKEKVWTKSYASYLTSLDVRDSLQKIKKRIKYLQKKRKKNIIE